MLLVAPSRFTLLLVSPCKWFKSLCGSGEFADLKTRE